MRKAVKMGRHWDDDKFCMQLGRCLESRMCIGHRDLDMDGNPQAQTL
jgi:hypothetical protein